ncbi:MAG: PadR family transcriptional regulator [Propionibacteriaceae bacterium]|jgi:PadR family transcriptional regulator PadR|nr:PadR family transcriptional regulator [Propionibacteriaceae bacterium]
MAINATGTLLELCVLAAVAHEDVYGYALTQLLKERLGVSESTIYPVMRRLQTQHCLDMYDVPCDGRNRRYYRLTAAGRQQLDALADEWIDFKERIDTILLKGDGK